MKRPISKSENKRNRVCRYCGGTIYAEQTGVVIEGVHVSPKRVDLHFHKNCILEMIEKFYDVIGEV